MIKFIGYTAFAFIVFGILLWVPFYFVELSANPANWSKEARSGFMTFVSVISFISGLAMAIRDSLNTKEASIATRPSEELGRDLMESKLHRERIMNVLILGLLSAFILLLTYLGQAFINLQADFTQWTTGDRIFTVLIPIIPIVACISYVIREDTNKRAI